MSPTELKENLIEQAGNQARVVDKFGKVLQTIGYILISILPIGLIVSAWTANWIGMGFFSNRNTRDFHLFQRFWKCP